MYFRVKLGFTDFTTRSPCWGRYRFWQRGQCTFVTKAGHAQPTRDIGEGLIYGTNCIFFPKSPLHHLSWADILFYIVLHLDIGQCPRSWIDKMRDAIPHGVHMNPEHAELIVVDFLRNLRDRSTLLMSEMFLLTSIMGGECTVGSTMVGKARSVNHHQHRLDSIPLLSTTAVDTRATKVCHKERSLPLHFSWLQSSGNIEWLVKNMFFAEDWKHARAQVESQILVANGFVISTENIPFATWCNALLNDIFANA